MFRWLLLALVALVAACQSGSPIGATCERNSGCASPLVCRFARCRSECVAQRDCPVGTTCLLDQNGLGSCALPDDPDCTHTGCEAPLACVGRACVNVCSVGVECPSGSACAPIGDGRARCVRVDGNDASIPDAATDAGPRADAGRCTPGSGPSGPCDTAIEIAVGDSFSCVRAQSGLIWCWGTGRSIGRDGDMTGCTEVDVQNFACPSPEPVRFEDASGHVGTTLMTDQIDAHDTGGCFTTHAGAIACFGTSGYEAPLGRDIQMGERARLVTDGTGTPLDLVDRFVIFDGTAIALRLGDGLWWGWGTDAGNVLRLPSVMRTPTAVSIGAPPVDIRTVSTGVAHACGLVTGATENVVCWGLNDHGQSSPGHASATPVGYTPIAGVMHATQLVMGRTHSCALADGGLVCWGAREFFYLDHDVTGCTASNIDCAPTVIPTVTSGGHTVAIAHLFPSRNSVDICASEADGTLYCWGEGYAAFDSMHPALVPGLPPVGSAVVSWTHACAIDTNSEVWCWGRNEAGELARLPLDPSGYLPAMRVAW